MIYLKSNIDQIRRPYVQINTNDLIKHLKFYLVNYCQRK